MKENGRQIEIQKGKQNR